MYLDDHAEQHRKYKVVTYVDHRPDDFIRYFDEYDIALDHFKQVVNSRFPARYTASAALIQVSTGEPLHRQTWRV